MQKHLTFFIALFIGFSSMAQLTVEQNHQIDSLKEVISTAKHDTTKINALEAWDNIIYISNPNLDLELNKQIQDICENNLTKQLTKKEIHKFKKGIAFSLNNIGSIFSDQGDYTKALDYYTKSLKIHKELENKKGVSAILGNIGSIYKNQGDYAKAIDYYTKSLKIAKEIENKKVIASSFNNIGLIYWKKGNLLEGLNYFNNSLKIQEEIGNKSAISTCLINIGNIYVDQNNYQEALIYYKKSLKIKRELGDKHFIALILNNIGSTYDDQGNYKNALIYYKKSLKIRRELRNKWGIAQSLFNIAIAYHKLGKSEDAITNIEDAINIAKETNALNLVAKQSKALYEIYKELGNTDKALELYELYISTKDTLAKQDAMEEGIRLEEKRKYNEKKIIDSTAHIIAITKEKENVTRKEAELQIKKDQEVMLYGGLGLVVLFSLFIFNRFRVTYKQKNLIETQHHELNETHREITDSINYAKRIQSAILPPIKVVKEYLKESFILYKPKDVVAGDFYWMEQKNGKVLFAAADCTGHGVPGAMVSVVCNNGLNRSVREHGLTVPGEILDRTREIVVQEFKKSEEDVKDGMDIALCCIEGMKLQYAGAYNPLWIIRNGEIIETKANKQPIGQFEKPEPYTTHSFDLEKGDAIYIFSDGYVDQFGGERGKKFKAKAFRELLLSIQDKTMEEQKITIDKTFETWKGDLEQIDDVCVIGVRV
jgi:serine phosphatase RsbU (regulator of sigma subunit)/Tfp pilus assembly protein PilF